ncbi:MAG: hypothetical protein KME45_32920 [Stenomitos rutilans HA7619-LM2]|jgi:hypothetical protein|nr:hypothetical protein [Stenomitos rutilans HA7619-LM2]
MRKSTLLALLTATSFIFSVSYTQNAQALTQDPIAAGAAVNQPPLPNQPSLPTATGQGNTTVLSVPNQINQVSSQLGNQVSSIFGGIQSFVTNLPRTFESVLNGALGAFGIPDLKQTTDQAGSTPTSSNESAALSEQLENQQGGQGSYAIRHDIAGKASRDTALGIAYAATLSQSAQQALAQRAQQTAQQTQANTQLGQESQSLDVTQQILQNLSLQTALNGQVNQEVLKEAQQGRVDRAIANTLSAQQARDLSMITTTDRRRGIAAGNAATQQTGLMTLPGGFYLGSETSDR